jgi:hypothetical protein
MRAFHLIPVGWQTVGIELPGENDSWFVLDNWSGSVTRAWDHLIFIKPDEDGTRYVDEVRIDAGIFSWPVSVYARLFYLYRQMRWRKIVAADFRPLGGSRSDATFCTLRLDGCRSPPTSAPSQHTQCGSSHSQEESKDVRTR